MKRKSAGRENRLLKAVSPMNSAKKTLSILHAGKAVSAHPCFAFCGMGESNSQSQFGKLMLYHLTNPADFSISKCTRFSAIAFFRVHFCCLGYLFIFIFIWSASPQTPQASESGSNLCSASSVVSSSVFFFLLPPYF